MLFQKDQDLADETMERIHTAAASFSSVFANQAIKET
jgi:hypothetical protein